MNAPDNRDVLSTIGDLSRRIEVSRGGDIETKNSVGNILYSQKELDILNKIISGEYSLEIINKDSRIIDGSTKNYVFTLKYTNIEGEINIVKIIFLKNSNTKVLVNINDKFFELQGCELDSIKNSVKKLYTLPVYTSDGKGGTKLINS